MHKHDERKYFTFLANFKWTLVHELACMDTFACIYAQIHVCWYMHMHTSTLIEATMSIFRLKGQTLEEDMFSVSNVYSHKQSCLATENISTCWTISKAHLSKYGLSLKGTSYYIHITQKYTSPFSQTKKLELRFPSETEKYKISNNW